MGRREWVFGMKLTTNEKWALGVAVVGLGGYLWMYRNKHAQQGLGDIPGRKWGWGPVGDIPAEKWGWGPTGYLGAVNTPMEAMPFEGEGQVVPGVPLGNIVWQQYL